MQLPNNALFNAILSLFAVDVRACVMAVGDYVFTVFDNLPTFSDHHANPDPGLAAVLCSFLPHC